jgi:hypothetical protein
MIRSTKNGFGTQMAESRFQFFTIRSRDVPLTWGDVQRWLAVGTPAPQP